MHNRDLACCAAETDEPELDPELQRVQKWHVRRSCGLTCFVCDGG
jgi:hypothetical protein